MSDVEFAVLGPLEVRRDGAVLDLGGPKQRAVLAFLLTHPGEPVSLDRLIDELWGDDAPPKATASLQAYVSNLRRVLEPDRAPRAPARILVSRPPGYALDLRSDALDAARFVHEAEGARRALAAGDAAAALDARGAGPGGVAGRRAGRLPLRRLRGGRARPTGRPSGRARAGPGGGAARARPCGRGRRRRRGTGGRAPLAGAGVGAAHAVPLPVGAAGRGAAGLPGRPACAR